MHMLSSWKLPHAERIRLLIRKDWQRQKPWRRKESEAFQEKFAWQKGDNPLQEFLKRKKEGKIAPIGYEDEPKGGIPLPSASFGVGGEFGVGGKFDNGMRFDFAPALCGSRDGWMRASWSRSQRARRQGQSRQEGAAEQSAGGGGRRALVCKNLQVNQPL